MKLLSILIILCPIICFSQVELKPFVGINFTNVNYHLIDNATGVDSSGLKRDNKLFPLAGMDLCFKFSNESQIITGLGVSWMGSNNFTDGVQGNARLDEDLILGYLRIPILYSYGGLWNIQIKGGISFNYNFRKNHNFFAINDDGSTSNVYLPIHFGVLIGLEKEFSNWSFGVNYHKGVSRIYDTKVVQSAKRSYLTLGGLQISVGYLIRE
jgi:hypothetical protein